ncbi:LOW QUALITY PROTEIN: uncharacterized protein [Amphiura filiformis]|uniref:LOW QUALITY PROTEIN: uncharacterized protein n=1 Tax=Amphiura filiformis TaxID=82378 RepID=UPI003B216C9E
MRFHSRCHGKNIELSEEDTVAQRTESFSHGVTFGQSPVAPLQGITVDIKTSISSWSGAIRYGFTNHNPDVVDPNSLPQYAIPDLTNKTGYWAKALSEKNTSKGFILKYHYTNEGSIVTFVNNEHVETTAIKDNKLDVSKPVWPLLDVYGCTQCIKLTGDSGDAPAEILARGPQAMLAFQHAANSGTKPVYRTRLMLVGQDRVGKTSLKKSLTGQRNVLGETSTDGIDTMDTCQINVEDAKAWQVHDTNSTEDNIDSGQQKGILDGSSGIEEEYAHAIASNIAQELLNQMKNEKKETEIVESENSKENMERKISGEGKESGDETTDSNKTAEEQEISGESDVTKDQESEKECDTKSNSLEQFTQSLDKNLSERVTQLVEEILAKAKASEETEKEGEGTTKEDANSNNIILSIWDFAGQSVYYTTHQVFLSSRAVYVIVFDLSHDLDATAQTQIRRGENEQVEWSKSEFTNLDFMDFWMRSIHAHTAENTNKTYDNKTLSPPIFIVGTHRKSLNDDPAVQKRMAEEKFRRIRHNLMGKPYAGHIVHTYYAVENNVDDDEDDQVVKLRKHIEEVSSNEPYMGEHMPLKWLRFEKAVSEATENGTNYLSLDKVRDIANELGIKSEDDLQIMLQFYHDLGVIIYYGNNGAVDESLRNTVILKPQWLVDVFRKVITVNDIDEQWAKFSESWNKLDEEGILEDKLINHMWREIMEQKPALIGLMEKFDLLCERIPPKKSKSKSTQSSAGKSFFVPCRLREGPNREDLLADAKKYITFYLTFGGFLPDGLFHRILTRAVRWSQEQGGREPKLYYRQARFFVDDSHDFVLEMAPARYARLKLTILRVDVYDDADDGTKHIQGDTVNPNAVAKVRHFIDSTLMDLRKMWMKRIQFEFSVQCICGRRCKHHQEEACKQDTCIHFLNLDECLNENIVMCEHRRVRTNVFRKWFPTEKPITVPLPITFTAANEKVAEEDIPPWVKCAAKLLNCGCDGADWVSLANKLGYKKKKMQVFMDEMNPALELILDWIKSSGNTALSIEMLVSYLEQMLRDDVVDVIQKGQESDLAPPSVFISYNWGIQDDVKILRDYLERAGFPCWMDIGQMGGGDSLYSKIYEGIRSAKVVLACVTPKYITSECCNREINLADLLKKPIIPIVFNSVPWPPPGGMGLIMSTLIYVDMHGVGGHGGSGKNADIQKKYQDIVSKIRQHISPITPKHVLRTNISNQAGKSPSESNSTAPSSATRSQNSRGGSPGQESGENGAGGDARIAPRAAVTKCAVCTIL